jgi:hypothetical protein
VKDDGEAAIQRERQEHEAADALREAAYDGLQRDLAFKAKLRAMREGNGIPAYHGPRAAK